MNDFFTLDGGYEGESNTSNKENMQQECDPTPIEHD